MILFCVKWVTLVLFRINHHTKISTVITYHTFGFLRDLNQS